MLFALSSPALASGPHYGHEEPLVQQEFERVYKEIASPTISTGTARSFTAEISSGTHGFFTNLTVTRGINSSSVRGTTTNDSAAAGFIGEAVRSVATSAACTTSGDFEDVTSISLTAGDWDVSGHCFFEQNGATWTNVRCVVASTAGNADVGSLGDNDALLGVASSATTPTHVSLIIPAYRVSISATTTYYLKSRCIYSAGSPQRRGRISARRVR